MLTVNMTLKMVDLFWCNLDTTALKHIAGGLAHNGSLTEMNIGRNKFTGEGCMCALVQGTHSELIHEEVGH